MSDSVRPHRRQPTRLPHPWNSPGKNTGVGCHFLLQCMKVKSESEVPQSCLTLRDPMDCSPPASSVHGIFQARVPEWDAIAEWGIDWHKRRCGGFSSVRWGKVLQSRQCLNWVIRKKLSQLRDWESLSIWSELCIQVLWGKIQDRKFK